MIWRKEPRKHLCQRVSSPKGVRKFHAALYQKLRGIVVPLTGFDTMCRVGYKIMGWVKSQGRGKTHDSEIKSPQLIILHYIRYLTNVNSLHKQGPIIQYAFVTML